MRYLHLVATGVTGLLLILGSADMPAIGDPASPASVHVSPRYIERGHDETGAANLVTAVLADYRAYDTLGETTVICAAGLACWFILGAGRSREGRVG